MNELAPVLLGLGAAAAWGAGDFTGGWTSRRASVYGVVIFSELVGLLGLALLAWLTGEAPPAVVYHLMAAFAGMCAGSGIVLLYIALASGQMSQAAPVSAVVAAAIPVLISAIWEGLPGVVTGAGLLLALAAIWLIAGGGDPAGGAHSGRLALKTLWLQLRLPVIAGVTFGVYFVLLHQAGQQAFYWPLIDARMASIVFLSGFVLLTRKPVAVNRAHWLPVALVGVLDTGGNGLFLLAGRAGRMDVASVLASLYPAGTVFLAWLLLKERITRSQMAGVLAALLAILLITL